MRLIRRLWIRPLLGWQHSFVEIDHKIFSTVILSLLLIQEGQLSVSGKRMCTILVNRKKLPPYYTKSFRMGAVLKGKGLLPEACKGKNLPTRDGLVQCWMNLHLP